MFAHTHAAHFSVEQPFLGAQLKYRIPNQVSLDGNTVEEHIEQAKYAENATQYQATLQFLSGSLMIYDLPFQDKPNVSTKYI